MGWNVRLHNHADFTQFQNKYTELLRTKNTLSDELPIEVETGNDVSNVAKRWFMACGFMGFRGQYQPYLLLNNMRPSVFPNVEDTLSACNRFLLLSKHHECYLLETITDSITTNRIDYKPTAKDRLVDLHSLLQKHRGIVLPWSYYHETVRILRNKLCNQSPEKLMVPMLRVLLTRKQEDIQHLQNMLLRNLDEVYKRFDHLERYKFGTYRIPHTDVPKLFKIDFSDTVVNDLFLHRSVLIVSPLWIQDPYVANQIKSSVNQKHWKTFKTFVSVSTCCNIRFVITSTGWSEIRKEDEHELYWIRNVSRILTDYKSMAIAFLREQGAHTKNLPTIGSWIRFHTEKGKRTATLRSRDKADVRASIHEYLRIWWENMSINDRTQYVTTSNDRVYIDLSITPYAWNGTKKMKHLTLSPLQNADKKIYNHRQFMITTRDLVMLVVVCPKWIDNPQIHKYYQQMADQMTDLPILLSTKNGIEHTKYWFNPTGTVTKVKYLADRLRTSQAKTRRNMKRTFGVWNKSMTMASQLKEWTQGSQRLYQNATRQLSAGTTVGGPQNNDTTNAQRGAVTLRQLFQQTLSSPTHHKQGEKRLYRGLVSGDPFHGRLFTNQDVKEIVVTQPLSFTTELEVAEYFAKQVYTFTEKFQGEKSTPVILQVVTDQYVNIEPYSIKKFKFEKEHLLPPGIYTKTKTNISKNGPKRVIISVSFVPDPTYLTRFTRYNPRRAIRNQNEQVINNSNLFGPNPKRQKR